MGPEAPAIEVSCSLQLPDCVSRWTGSRLMLRDLQKWLCNAPLSHLVWHEISNSPRCTADTSIRSCCYLSQRHRKTLLMDEDSLGGNIRNINIIGFLQTYIILQVLPVCFNISSFQRLIPVERLTVNRHNLGWNNRRSVDWWGMHNAILTSRSIRLMGW